MLCLGEKRISLTGIMVLT
ncbi:hypothetical protein B4U80_03059 [Leptotrombidium deliense]|uniref:Uncharacterized protein n=1 Tax=Leptotrombidium deliense TaxID=299467 RepID=A0A443S709_9ACAR|nr:hypothetical protein B4U80_03059 [Leptotrombidium deliense]